MKPFALGLAAAAVMGAGMAANAALPVTSGLVCWYDAGVGVITGGGVIRTWNDQSGNAHHGTVGSGSTVLAADQLNAKPAAQFRGSYLNLAGLLFVKEQYLVMRSPTATWRGGGGFLCRAEGRGSSYDMRDGDVTFWPDQAPDAFSKNGTPVLVEGTDNSQFVLQPITDYMILRIVVKDNDTSATSYQIGRADTGTIDFDVVEIIGYDRTLFADEEASMGSYLADKYDLITAYPVLTPQAKILSFGLPGMPAVIDQSAKTIAWTVPGGTAVTNLAPEFTLSDGATCDHVSGTTYNFTSPVNYIVTPSVGAPKTYTVTVTADPQLSALPVTSGLVCWYDAGVGVTTDGDGVIQTWNDLSGQAHHAIPIIRDRSITDMTVLEQNQLNSKPAAQFRGAYLSLDNPYFTAREQYVVVRSTTPTWSGGGAIFGRRGDIAERSYYLQGGTTKFWGDPWPGAVSKDGGESLPRNESGNLGYDLDPITSFMLLKIDMGNIGAGTYQIGKTGDGLLKDFDVAEIVGYDSPLSVEDENLLGSYFKSKYALPFVTITAFANILTFDFGQYGLATISGTDISITVPYGTDVMNLAPAYTLSTGATCDKENGSTQDFTSPVTYTVTSSDNLITKAYFVSVTVTPASTACDILTFGLGATITGTDIAWTVPFDTDVTNLMTLLTVSPFATVSPTSGTSVDYSGGPVTYIVTAQDGIATKEYTVTVTKDAPGLLIGWEQYNPGGPSSFPSPIDCESGDLLEMSGVVATGELTPEWRSGSFYNGVTNFDDNTTNLMTYALDLESNPLGYDIQEIRLFSGWDAYRTGQFYDISYSLIGAPGTFFPFGTVITGERDGALMTRTYHSGGTPILTGVAAIQFDILPTSGGGEVYDRGFGYGTVYREIDVLGTPTTSAGGGFKRGDVDADGAVNITDVIAFLGWNFRSDPPSLVCPDSADADDSGDLNVTDAIVILGWQFRGDPPVLLPPGAEDCGPDDPLNTPTPIGPCNYPSESCSAP